MIPILLRPTADWEDAPFGKLQPIPRNRKSVSTWQHRDEAFFQIAKEIKEVVEKLKEKAK